MNTNIDETVAFLENRITEEEDTITLEETIATLAMNSADSWSWS